MTTTSHHAHQPSAHADGHDGAGHGGHTATPSGLAVSANGLTLQPTHRTAPRGAETEYAFRITSDAGDAITVFDVEHDKRMHMILVRRDLTGFQHLHPDMDPDGTWRIPLTIDEAGTYRVFADFAHEGSPSTLGVDLVVPGESGLQPLPAPAPTTRADGYSISMITGYGEPGAKELAFEVTRDGIPVPELEPYLGARGHLVALREGDLAFLHVHPLDGDPGAQVRFHVAWPSPGSYRLFLQVQHEGRIVTAPFTVQVAG